MDDYPYGTIAVRTANPDLKWEVVTQANVGLDFALFNGSLTGTLDYFNKVTSDVILYATTPDPINPTEKYWTNFPDMEVKNKGYEVALDYRGEISDDFSYNLGGNVSFIDNEVEGSIYSVITSGAAQGSGQTGATINGYINGEAIGAFYMKDFIGIGDDGLNEFRDVVEDGVSLDNDPGSYPVAPCPTCCTPSI